MYIRTWFANKQVFIQIFHTKFGNFSYFKDERKNPSKQPFQNYCVFWRISVFCVHTIIIIISFLKRTKYFYVLHVAEVINQTCSMQLQFRLLLSLKIKVVHSFYFFPFKDLPTEKALYIKAHKNSNVLTQKILL